MAGTLYGIGVGPGDPELLTLKAARILRETPVIAVPVTQPGGDSYALDVVSGLVQPDQQIVKLLFPMIKDAAAKAEFRRAAARTVQQYLVEGQDVAFLTEGDPLLHSTFIYVLNDLSPGMQVQVVPGISSITAAAAQAQLPLVCGDQRLAIIPTTFEDEAALRRIFADFDTVVLLKFHRMFVPLLGLLDELGLTESTVLVERASHAGGRVVRDIRTLRGQAVNYLSLLIVQTGRGQTAEVDR